MTPLSGVIINDDKMMSMNKQPMKLQELAAGVARLPDGGGVVVRDLAIDSRKVSPGTLFFCLKGANTDGHQHAAEALARGAVALVVEEQLPLEAPQLRVESVREVLGIMASAFYGHPCRDMKVVAITGTNGKTTTSFMLRSICEAAGEKGAVFGTLGVLAEGVDIETRHTTPEAVDVQKMLSALRSNRVEVVAMEVSSHAIYYARHYGCLFDCVVFTNLSQDHLDFHASLEDYWSVKRRLFEDTRWHKKECRAVLNTEDECSLDAEKAFHGESFWYGEGERTRIEAAQVGRNAFLWKDRVTGEAREVQINLPGRINLLNALAAGTSALSMGYGLDAVAKGISSLQSVPGRMEDVTPKGASFRVLVDYAHTPDGLRNVLSAGRQSLSSGGRLLTVFGCGGDRDRDKRPKMGSIAAELADIAILTSDNPRTEDPMEIIKEVSSGAPQGSLIEIEDRREAIAKALKMAKPGDVILIAGKGHEQGQIVGDSVLPFDDRLVVAEIMGSSR